MTNNKVGIIIIIKIMIKKKVEIILKNDSV